MNDHVSDRASVKSGGDGLVLVQATEITGVWKLLFNRPPVNAMSMAMYSAVIDALDELEHLPDVACVLVGSAVEGAFCAGADANELDVRKGMSTEQWDAREALTLNFQARIENFAVPTIAVIDGYAIGAGLVFASLCDLRFSSERSWFSLPELDVSRLGGASHSLRIFPQAVVRAMYFQGLRVQASKALALGAVNEVVGKDELWLAAMDAAAQIAQRDPYALRLAKRALNLGQSAPTLIGDRMERLYSYRLAMTDRAQDTRE